MAIRDDQFWAKFLGVEPSDWNVSGISVRAHVGLAGFRGFWCFRRLDHTVVSVPAGWVSLLRHRVRDAEADEIFNQVFLADLLGDNFERLIGPAFQGCLEPSAFRQVSAKEVRPLTQEDSAALNRLRAECSTEDVQNSGIDKSIEHMGYFQGAKLLAVAGYRQWTEDAGDPCILTHPESHGRGFGTAVTSAVVHRALNEGKLLLYQTLEANVAAVRIARKLGYEQYARHVAVRLKTDVPSSQQT
jgi:GNAT superfamily N-acetyltransferase